MILLITSFKNLKKLQQTNTHSIYAKYRGGITHSELIQSAGQIGDKNNTLQVLNGIVFALHLICNENQFLMTNSLGFHAITDNKKIRCFVVPISNKLAIVVQANYDKINPVSHYTLTDELNINFNKSCFRAEKEMGHGLIIAHSEIELRKMLTENEIKPIN